MRKKRQPTDFCGLMHAVQKEICVNQAQKKEVYEQIEHLLYQEWRISIEQVEAFYYPFGQSGYLSARQKFEIMLYLAAKEAHGDGRKQLFARAGWDAEEKTEIDQRDIEEIYFRFLEEEWIKLHEEDKKVLLIDLLYEPFGYGIVERLLGQETEGLLAGELFWRAYQKSGVEKTAGKEARALEEGIGVLEQGRLIRLKFLHFSDKEELCRVTKRLVCMGGKGELTVAEPEWSICLADGTTGHAIRPPKAQGWGFEIIRARRGYGSDRRFCRI